MSDGGSPRPTGVDRGRRLAIGACVAAAPLVVGAALARGVRSTRVGAGDFADSQVSAGPFPKQMRGPDGEPFVLPSPPRRIVSTFLGADELLAALAPERVVAVSVYADDPATSNCHDAYPRRLPRLRTEPETIVSLEPDLVCMAGFAASDALRLIVGAGLPVLRWSKFNSFADVQGQIRLFGAALGEDARAAALADSIRALLADLETRLRPVRPTRVLYYDPPTFTMGRGTLVNEILMRAGGRNVVDELGLAGPAQIGLETVLSLQPEAIVMPNYADNTPTLRALAQDRVWQAVPAVRQGRVHEIPGAWIATVSHHAARGLERVARVLHPEVF